MVEQRNHRNAEEKTVRPSGARDDPAREINNRSSVPAGTRAVRCWFRWLPPPANLQRAASAKKLCLNALIATNQLQIFAVRFGNLQQSFFERVTQTSNVCQTHDFFKGVEAGKFGAFDQDAVGRADRGNRSRQARDW